MIRMIAGLLVCCLAACASRTATEPTPAAEPEPAVEPAPAAQPADAPEPAADPEVPTNADGAQMCGGIAGFQCPEGHTCVDDPNDGCDPSENHADCAGICQAD